MNLRAPYSPPLPARKARNRSELHISAMTIRTRKLIGTIALLLLVVVWSLLGMTVAQTPWLANSGLLQAIFYVVAGVGWVLPAMSLVSWKAARGGRACSGRCRSSAGWRVLTPSRTGTGRLYRRKCKAGKHHAHDAQRALPSVPGDARKRVQIGSAFRLHDTRYCRRRAGETGLRG